MLVCWIDGEVVTRTEALAYLEALWRGAPGRTRRPQGAISLRFVHSERACVTFWYQPFSKK